jgi:hypothetical protein
MSQDYKAAWAKYLDFSKKGGTMTFVDLVKSSGLRSPLEEGGLTDVVKGAQEALEKMQF